MIQELMRQKKKCEWDEQTRQSSGCVSVGIKALWSSADLRTSEALSNYHVWVSHSTIIYKMKGITNANLNTVDWEPPSSNIAVFNIVQRGEGGKGFFNNLRKKLQYWENVASLISRVQWSGWFQPGCTTESCYLYFCKWIVICIWIIKQSFILVWAV